MDFEFFVGGIEDAILQLLKDVMQPLGVKEFATYSGELDTEQLKKAISSLTPRFPLVMVSYAEGVDTQMPSTSAVLGSPIHFRHDCTFLVVCASADARGDYAQRRGRLVGNKKVGCYKMLSKVRETLSGLRIKTVVENDDVLLTNQPLMPESNEFIARLPNITAYAIPFQTYFNWSTKDRSRDGTAVTEVSVGVNSLNAPSEPNNNLPGVKFII